MNWLVVNRPARLSYCELKGSTAQSRKEAIVAELKIADSKSVEARKVDTEGAEHVNIKWLISKNDGAERFQMRVFEVMPGGRTPLHSHDWEHEVYILAGEGILVYEGEEKAFSKGFFAFVPGGKVHSFVNTGGETLEFLCMVPVT
jgi:quercetin dioxygenase-like cupin family protein